MLKLAYNSICLFVLHLFLLPHVILYYCSKNKYLIDMDIAAFKERQHFNLPRNLLLICLLKFNPYYRKIFYSRIGKLSIFIKWYFPGDHTFFIHCNNIGGGINPAHPFATILNAKSIGKNFAIKQNTTIGNKFEGDNDAIPTIGDNVFVGANAVIIGKINIGDNAIIGAGAVVVKDVPANSVVVGNPAHVIKTRN